MREVYYHGSPTKGIKVLEPRVSYVLKGRKAVFASPHRWVAAASARQWRDDDFEQGTINGRPYMKEQYAGAFKKVYSKGGYLYHLPVKGFKSRKGLTRHEVISRRGVTPVKEEYIKDPVAEMEREGAALIRFGDKKGWKAFMATTKQASATKIHNMVKQAAAALVVAPVLNTAAAVGIATADALMYRYASGITRRMTRNADLKLQLAQEKKDGKPRRYPAKS